MGLPKLCPQGPPLDFGRFRQGVVCLFLFPGCKRSFLESRINCFQELLWKQTSDIQQSPLSLYISNRPIRCWIKSTLFNNFLQKPKLPRHKEQSSIDVRGQERRHPSSLSPSFPSLQRNKTTWKPNYPTIVPVFPCPTIAGSMESFPSFRAATQSLLVPEQQRLTHPAWPVPALSGPSPSVCFVSSASPHWSSQLHSGRFTGGI